MGHKDKRGARGSTETDETSLKRFNEELDAATAEGSEEEDEEVVHEDEEPTWHEIRSMLVEIQITVADIQRKHNSFVEHFAIT